MECHVKSKTSITVQWYKASALVKESTRHIMAVQKEKAEEYLATLDIKVGEGGEWTD